MNPKRFITSILAVVLLWACANIGNPEGGPFDVTPPRLIKAKPERGATAVSAQRIVLEFDEFVKLSGQDKIIISPPQHKPPIIVASGRTVSVKLADSLRPNTTYSVYFDDAVVDNNEDNPLENLEYSFSTGTHIDSMQFGGVVLDAETLEPVAGLAVGAYLSGAWQDSLVFKDSFPYGSKTNKQGRFVVRGLPDSLYRIFALKDDDNDYRYKKDAEGFAFLSTAFKTTKLDSIKTDTIRIDSIVRRDTLYRDSLVTYNHTYYYPNELVLRYFAPQNRRRGLERSNREDSLRITLDFAEELGEAPVLHSLDKPTDNPEALYYPTLSGRSVSYWLRDKELIGADSIRFTITYSKTDSLMQLVEQRDTLTFMKPRVKEERKKPKKDEDAKRAENSFKLSLSGASGILASTPKDSLILSANLPIDSLSEQSIRLEMTLDSVYKPQPYRLERDKLNTLRYNLLFERQYGAKYRVKIDSGVIHSIYGQVADSLHYEQSVEEENALGALLVKVEGLSAKDAYVAQLLDKGGNVLLSHALKPAEVKTDSLQAEVQLGDKPTNDKPKLEAKVSSSDGGKGDSAHNVDSLANASGTEEVTHETALAITFQDLKPDTYYLRMFVDDNADGLWTSGDYPHRLPELMFYSPDKYEVKKSFTTSEVWKPLSIPPSKQKPLDLLKTKPEEKRKRQDKNKEYYKRLDDKKRKH